MNHNCPACVASKMTCDTHFAMKTVTESIYTSPSLVIPLADVQHVEKHNPGGLIVVTKHTRWDCDRDCWANNIWIDKDEAERFLSAWCRYRGELETDTLKNLEPDHLMAGFDRAIAAIKEAQ